MPETFIIYNTTDKQKLAASIGNLLSLDEKPTINVVVDNLAGSDEMLEVIVKGCCGQPEPTVSVDGLYTITDTVKDGAKLRIIKYSGNLRKEMQITEGIKRSIKDGETTTIMISGSKVHPEFIKISQNHFSYAAIGAMYTDYFIENRYIPLNSLRVNRVFKENINNITIRNTLINGVSHGNVFEMMKNLHSKSILIHIPQALTTL